MLTRSAKNDEVLVVDDEDLAQVVHVDCLVWHLLRQVGETDAAQVGHPADARLAHDGQSITGQCELVRVVIARNPRMIGLPDADHGFHEPSHQRRLE